MRKTLFLIASLVIVTCSLVAQDSPAFRRAQTLRHGINASEWFAQTNNYSPSRLASYTDANDIKLMHQMGFDHVRVSIDPAIFSCIGHPDNCATLTALDGAIHTMLENQLAVIVDLHPSDDFKNRLATSDDAVDRFVQLWEHIAAHYASYDPDRVFFEILNEPVMPDPYRWGAIQARVLAAIRHVAPAFTVILEGARWSAISEMILLPDVTDHNIIYNFHYYDPHIFTHQGAGWSSSFLPRLHDIPYPPNDDAVQAAIKATPDSFTDWALLHYELDGWGAHRIGAEIAFAANWARARNAPLTCNEFGVYRDFTKPEDRARWISDVRKALEANGIGWTMWDYRGSFGVVVKHGSVATPDDVTLRALGLK